MTNGEHYKFDSEEDHEFRWLTLTGPRAIYEFLSPLNNEGFHTAEFRTTFSLDEQEKFAICGSIIAAFRALIGFRLDFIARASFVNINGQWRDKLLAILHGNNVSDQGLQFSSKKPILTWNNLHFRSQTEIHIVQELDRKKVLFLPNCIARLGFRERRNREADFLICSEGKWGILEVDGGLAHTPTRTAEDHERDRLFQTHGILLVQHFAASECWENAEGVVAKFLELLRKTR